MKGKNNSEKTIEVEQIVKNELKKHDNVAEIYINHQPTAEEATMLVISIHAHNVSKGV